MKVRVVSVTQSLVEEKVLTAEELLVYIARCSNPSNQLNTETSDKLIKYLIKHKHWSPLDMINLTVEVTTSRMIAQQILRHWSIKPQEFSQRYAEVVDIEPMEFRRQAKINRQGSDEFIGLIDKDWSGEFHITSSVHYVTSEEAFWLSEVAAAINNIKELYRVGITLGIGKECVRQILPLATSTTMYLNGSVRSWVHYLEQRTDLHAQKEHRIVAEEIRKIFAAQFPNVWKAIESLKES